MRRNSTNHTFKIAIAVVAGVASFFTSVAVAHADTFVSPTAPADGACLSEGSGGIANGCFAPTFAISGTSTAGANSCWKTALAVSLLGSACAAPDGNVLGVPISGAAVSLAGASSADWIAVSGTGPASSGWIAISATNSANGTFPVSGQLLVAGQYPCADNGGVHSATVRPGAGVIEVIVYCNDGTSEGPFVYRIIPPT